MWLAISYEVYYRVYRVVWVVELKYLVALSRLAFFFASQLYCLYRPVARWLRVVVCVARYPSSDLTNILKRSVVVPHKYVVLFWVIVDVLHIFELEQRVLILLLTVVAVLNRRDGVHAFE